MLALSGALVGAEFPLAAQLLSLRPEDSSTEAAYSAEVSSATKAGSAKADQGRSAAAAYGADLWGASLGGLVTATLLLPLIGMESTCRLTAGLVAVALGLALAQLRRAR
jgi:predicted membrane-bound spermidine synthase